MGRAVSKNPFSVLHVGEMSVLASRREFRGTVLRLLIVISKPFNMAVPYLASIFQL